MVNFLKEIVRWPSRWRTFWHMETDYVRKVFRGSMPIEDLDAPFDIVRYEGKLYSLRAFSMVNGARHPPG